MSCIVSSCTASAAHYQNLSIDNFNQHTDINATMYVTPKNFPEQENTWHLLLHNSDVTSTSVT